MYIDSSFIMLFRYSINFYVFLHDRCHARGHFHVPGHYHVHGHFLYHNYVFPPMNVPGLPCVHLQMNIHHHDDYLE